MWGTENWKIIKARLGRGPPQPSPPRPVFHLPPAPVTSATCSTPWRSRGHGRRWSPPLPHLLPTIRAGISTPPPHSPPPPRLPRVGERTPRSCRRRRRAQPRPTAPAGHATVSSELVVVDLVSPVEKSSRDASKPPQSPSSSTSSRRIAAEIPPAPSRPRARCPPLRARGEHPHHPQPPVEPR